MRATMGMLLLLLFLWPALAVTGQTAAQPDRAVAPALAPGLAPPPFPRRQVPPGRTPVPVGARRGLPAQSAGPGSAPRDEPGATPAGGSHGVISLDSLAPVRPTAQPGTAPAADSSHAVISLDALAPVQPSSPPAAAAAPPARRVITLESDDPPPMVPPAAPAAVREATRVVPPATGGSTPRAPAATANDVISLDSLGGGPAPGGRAARLPAPGAIPQAPPTRRPSTPLPAVNSATVPPRPRATTAAAPTRPAFPPPPRARAATRWVPPRVERLVPAEPPAPIPAAMPAPPPPLSAPGMLATALDSERHGQRVEALAHYRALVNAHPASREGKWAARRITAMTETFDLEAQEGRAAVVLSRAADLEAAGDVALALTYFRQVAKVYPRTPSARAAAGRIKALGGE